MSRPAFAHALVAISADQVERPGHLSLEFVAHEVLYDKILKKKLQYTFSGTDCVVFKGSTHHGGLGLSLRFR